MIVRFTYLVFAAAFLIAPLGVSQTVDDAIALALRHNPQLDISAAETAATRAQRIDAVGQFMPSVSATVSASQEN